MGAKKMNLKFRFISKTLCFYLSDSGSEFQTVGPKTEKDLLPKVSRQKRGTVSNEVSQECSVLEGQYG